MKINVDEIAILLIEQNPRYSTRDITNSFNIHRNQFHYI